jgi:alpha-1,2-mannosyltransferase
LGNHLIILALLFVIPLFLLRASSNTRFSLVFVLTCVYSLTFFPTVLTLNHGQTNLLLLAFILAFWLLARANYAVAASLCLALAVFLKTYPLIILPMLLVAGRRRECAYTAAWLGSGTIISLLMLPSAIWRDWLLNVLPTGGYTRIPAGLFSPAGIWNQSLNGFFARALTESPWSNPIFVDASLARKLTYTSAGLIAAISGMAVFRGSRIHPDSLDRTMLVALPAMYLVAPFSWEHHLVYLLPSILILLTARSRLPVATTLLFYSASIGAAVLIGLDRGLPFKFYSVAVLWVLCIFTACSKRIQLPNNGMESDE